MLWAKSPRNWFNGYHTVDFLKLKLSKFLHFSPLFPFGKILLSPLGKGWDPSFGKKIESPSLKDALCQVWLKLDHWFWRRREKCEKFTNEPRDGQQTTGNQKSSFKLSAKGHVYDHRSKILA